MWFFSAGLLLSSVWPASAAIPHVTPEMEESDYWIARIPEPDRVLLSPRQIERLNEKILRLEPTAVDPASLEKWTQPSLFLNALEREENGLLSKTLYDRRGKRIDKKSVERLKSLCALSDIPDLVPVRFGLIVEECSLRTFPTHEVLVEEKGKFDFDILQQTTFHPGTEVAVVWESRDGEWVYVVSSLLRGWVQKAFVAAFDSKEDFLAYRQNPKLIATDRETPFYERPAGEPIGAWKMGTVFHTDLLKEEGDFYKVHSPIRGTDGKLFLFTVYARKETAGKEYLPLTGRSIVTQAFKLYGAPYGWGGLHEGWDCSSFLRDVFLTMGVELPRNSAPQSRSGKVTPFSKKEEEAKARALEKSPPEATFIKLENHIMLYLGKKEGRFYVIHATAGYRFSQFYREKVRRLMRVIVSDLELGEGSKKGSLFERIISVNQPFE